MQQQLRAEAFRTHAAAAASVEQQQIVVPFEIVRGHHGYIPGFPMRIRIFLDTSSGFLCGYASSCVHPRVA